MAYRITYAPAAQNDLQSIERWIAGRADPDTAVDYILRLRDACRSLADFPNRGTPRRAALRSIVFSGRAVIYYRVGRGTVTITAILHRGRDAVA